METGLGEKFERLSAVMARLRSPGGCPWDVEQTPESLSRHLLEEAYETVEAIDAEDWDHLREELGDLLLQIVFQSRIAEENGRFELADVVDGIIEKLERRHPHIFGTVRLDSAEQVAVSWDRIKREEDGLKKAVRMPRGLPAVLASMKVQGQAARVGFDWPGGEGVLDKLYEEISELENVFQGPVDARERELGDLLFTVVNLARHLGVDPEGALRRTCARFIGRYSFMEEEARRMGLDFESLPLEEKDRLWEVAKEKRANGGKT